MNAAIVRKTLRDTWPLLVIITVAVVILECVFVIVVGTFAKELEYMWGNPLIGRFARMLVGADLSGQLTGMGFVTFGFAHPLLFALNWVFLLTTCTRVIAGEMERGTADLLLTLPVGRTTIYTSVTAAWLLCGIPITLAAVAGAKLGETIRPFDEPLDYAVLAKIATNLFALYACIGSVTLCASSWLGKRGSALALVLGWLLSSFLLNFLAQMSSIAERISILGLLRYYRPILVLRSGEWPTADMAVLAVLAGVFWMTGVWHFARRDIPAA